jgi:hypothetical protein
MFVFTLLFVASLIVEFMLYLIYRAVTHYITHKRDAKAVRARLAELIIQHKNFDNNLNNLPTLARRGLAD